MSNVNVPIPSPQGEVLQVSQLCRGGLWHGKNYPTSHHLPLTDLFPLAQAPACC